MAQHSCRIWRPGVKSSAKSSAVRPCAACVRGIKEQCWYNGDILTLINGGNTY